MKRRGAAWSLARQLDADLAPLVAAAHELKTPISVISYLAASLQDGAELTASERDQAIERLLLTTARMSRLVEGFTRAYRIEQDPRQLELLGLEPVNFRHVLEEVADELQPMAHQLDQRIELAFRGRKRLVIANRQLLDSVIVNLLDNALKHNPPGQTVTVSLGGRGEFLRGSITDQGSEVSRRDLRSLRGNLGAQLQPLRGRSHSSGIGLYIASELTKAMGGQLGAICHQRSGTTFYADLRLSGQMSLL